jgi:c-di-GMP-binding flagellar brake protein YcgR
MGAVSPAHKNQLISQGLRSGRALRLNIESGDRVEALSTRVEDLTEKVLTVLTPMVRMHDRPIERGTKIRVNYTFDNRIFGFVTESLGVSPDGQFQLLTVPEVIKSTDRRGVFRLQAFLQPESVYRVVVNQDTPKQPGAGQLKCSILDISEGGVCLSSRHGASVGERLGMDVDLPDSGQLRVRMRVVDVEVPPKGQLNHRIHCVFVDLAVHDRDRIGKFLLRRQLAMRHRGQL